MVCMMLCVKVVIAVFYSQDQPKKVYVERLSQLEKLGAPVVRRREETQGRPSTFDQLGSKIVHYEKILTQYDSGVSSLQLHVALCSL